MMVPSIPVPCVRQRGGGHSKPLIRLLMMLSDFGPLHGRGSAVTDMGSLRTAPQADVCSPQESPCIRPQTKQTNGK